MSQVYIKNKKNGITYVYESQGYWDKDKKQSRSKRICIGKLEPDTGELIPSKRLTYTNPVIPVKPGPVTCIETSRSFYGATYLFDAIGKKLGIADDLKKCFPDTYKQILSIAYVLQEDYIHHYKEGKVIKFRLRDRLVYSFKTE